MIKYLFVYGTLKRGNDHPTAKFLHQNSKWVGEGAMKGELFDLGDYPGAVYNPECNSKVSGEVFELLDPSTIFSVLDEYECMSDEYPEPHEYVRKCCQIRVGKRWITCWVYLYNWNTKPGLTS